MRKLHKFEVEGLIISAYRQKEDYRETKHVFVRNLVNNDTFDMDPVPMLLWDNARVGDSIYKPVHSAKFYVYHGDKLIVTIDENVFCSFEDTTID